MSYQTPPLGTVDLCHPTACTAAVHPHQVCTTFTNITQVMIFIPSDFCVYSCPGEVCVFLDRWLCPVRREEFHRYHRSLIMALQLSMAVSHHALLDSHHNRPHPHPAASERGFTRCKVWLKKFCHIKNDSMCVFICDSEVKIVSPSDAPETTFTRKVGAFVNKTTTQVITHTHTYIGCTLLCLYFTFTWIIHSENI